MARTPTRTINLALQGGGAHGAYSWGVLDRLLQEESVVIEGVSGTSAGAMNAVIMVNGYALGGREGAREALATFWKTVSEMGALTPFHQAPGANFLAGWNMDWSPAYHYFDMLSRLMSPYDFNPMNVNPLRSVLDEMLDLKALNACSVMKVFVTATQVKSGQARIFHCHEITADVLLASACIPLMFQAIEIDGEPYWDGGYMGNPAVWPLIYHCDSDDVVLVQINPIHRDDTPKTASEIINRLNEITFNSSLIAEMRAIEFVQRLIEAGRLDREEYKRVNVHLIYSAEEMKKLNASSKMNTGWDFMQHLHGLGYAAAEHWLATHMHDIGVRSTINIREKFLGLSAPKKQHPKKQGKE